MSAGDTLRKSDAIALNNSQIISHVYGKANEKMKNKNKIISISAAAFVVAIIVFFGIQIIH